MVFIFAAGTLSDRFGRRVIYGFGAAAAAVWLWLLFPLLDSKSELAIVAAFASGLAVHAFMYGPQGAFIAEQFPARVRYVGASVAYTFAGVFAGGLAPLAFHQIYQASKQTGLIVVYAGIALVITVDCAAGVPQRSVPGTILAYGAWHRLLPRAMRGHARARRAPRTTEFLLATLGHIEEYVGAR